MQICYDVNIKIAAGAKCIQRAENKTCAAKPI
jgi:hypothetical protein